MLARLAFFRRNGGEYRQAWLDARRSFGLEDRLRSTEGSPFPRVRGKRHASEYTVMPFVDGLQCTASYKMLFSPFSRDTMRRGKKTGGGGCATPPERSAMLLEMIARLPEPQRQMVKDEMVRMKTEEVSKVVEDVFSGIGGVSVDARTFNRLFILELLGRALMRE